MSMKADIKVTLTKEEIQKALAEYVKRNIDLANPQVNPTEIKFTIGTAYDHDPRMTTSYKILESATVPLTQRDVSASLEDPREDRGGLPYYMDR